MPSSEAIFISGMRVCGDGAIFATHQDQPNIKLIPAMLRRRLSTEAKAAAAFAMELCDEQRLPILWCSRYGSLARSERMMLAIAEQTPMSPADFSLSVHNAEAGIYSIAHHNQHPVIALSCAQDPLYNYLLEAKLMAEEEQSDVVIVISDQPLPTKYQEIALENTISFSLVLRVSAQGKGDEVIMPQLKGALLPSIKQLVKQLSQSSAF